MTKINILVDLLCNDRIGCVTPFFMSSTFSYEFLMREREQARSYMIFHLRVLVCLIKRFREKKEREESVSVLMRIQPNHRMGKT